MKMILNHDSNVTWITDIKAKNQTIMSMAQTTAQLTHLWGRGSDK